MSQRDKSNWLIIANGEPLATDQWLKLAEHKSIMVLDGALMPALMNVITPDVVIGDFDSFDPSTNFVDSSITFVHEREQETTDLEKGLRYLTKINPESVTIIHATGWRLDHTLHNLRLLKRFHGVLKSLSIVTALEKIYYIENQTVILQADGGQPMALLAFPEAVVHSNGLQYNMDNLKLQFGYQESTSNALLESTANISVTGSALLLISHSTWINLK